MLNRCIVGFIVTVALLSNAATAQDWPQWRGIDRDGIIAEPITPAADGPKLSWSAKIGSGYSGPTVADGKVYVMDRLTEPKQVERVLCFDQATGDNIWTKHLGRCLQGHRLSSRTACFGFDPGR